MPKPKSKSKRRPVTSKRPRVKEKKMDAVKPVRRRPATRSRDKHVSEGCGLLADFVHAQFKSYVAAAEAMREATGFLPPKASFSHWIVGKHKPNARASDALQRWAGIPIQAWYTDP